MRRFSMILNVLFVIPLMLFCIISLTDTDATVSERENRNLKTFPQLTWGALVSGEYFKGIEEYYSDTFPARDFFISASNGVKKLFGFGGSTELVKTQGGNDMGMGENMFGEEGTPSQPEATPFVPSQQNADENDIQKSKSIIIIDTFAMELYSQPTANDAAYAQAVNRLKQGVGENVKVYNLVAPTSIEFYSPAKYHEGKNSQKAAIEDIYSQLQGVTPVDAYSEIVQHTDDYLYFRTDHHWTARGAYYAYRAFSKEAGFEPIELSWMGSGTQEGFVGSMYRYTQSEKLKQNPDVLEYFMPPENESFAYKDTSLQNPMPVKAVYDHVGGENKYLAFYGGDSAIIKTVTGNKNGRKILVTKESYANAFVPFLISHYEEIYIVDPRRVSMDLPAFVQNNGIGEVLVLNYSFATSNSTFMNGFKALIP